MSNELLCCPACTRVIDRDTPIPPRCARCEADLTAWFDVADLAKKTMRQAILQLPCNPVLALRLSRRSRFLHADPRTRELSVLIERRSGEALARPPSPVQQAQYSDVSIQRGL